MVFYFWAHFFCLFQLEKTLYKAICYKFCSAESGCGSTLRRTFGSSSAKNECGSTAQLLSLALPVPFLLEEDSWDLCFWGRRWNGWPEQTARYSGCQLCWSQIILNIQKWINLLTATAPAGGETGPKTKNALIIKFSPTFYFIFIISTNIIIKKIIRNNADPDPSGYVLIRWIHLAIS